MKIKFSKIKDFLKKLPRILGEHAFLTFLGFVMITAVLGGFLFYKYSILPERVIPEITEIPVRFNEDLYQKVLKTWQDREQRFQEVESKTYSNPFLKPTPISGPEELTE